MEDGRLDRAPEGVQKFDLGKGKFARLGYWDHITKHSLHVDRQYYIIMWGL